MSTKKTLCYRKKNTTPQHNTAQHKIKSAILVGFNELARGEARKSSNAWTLKVICAAHSIPFSFIRILWAHLNNGFTSELNSAIFLSQFQLDCVAILKQFYGFNSTNGSIVGILEWIDINNLQIIASCSCCFFYIFISNEFE